MKKILLITFLITLSLTLVTWLFKKGSFSTSVSVAFDQEDAKKISVFQGDPGLVWSIVDGTGCLMGMTQDEEWGPSNGFELPVTGDTRAKAEVSGEFKIVQSDGHQLVNLSTGFGTNGSLCLFFNGEQGRGSYHIQTRWLKIPSTLISGENEMFGFGNEKEVFHKMKIALDRKKSEAMFYVDDIHLGTVKVNGELSPITKVKMDVQTPFKGTRLDIRFDNLKVCSTRPFYKR